MAYGLFDSRFLDSARIQRIIEEAAPLLERSRPLVYIDRLTQVNATDDELMGRFTSKVYAADVLPDGGKATIYQGGSIELDAYQLANLKLGKRLDQRDLSLLSKLEEMGGRARQEDQYFDWLRNIVTTLLFGIRQRMNHLACSMMIDNFSYSKYGVISAGTWGMPSLLNVEYTTPWSSDGGTTVNTAATPINDLMTFDSVDADNYGLGVFDRYTMSTKAFDFMVGTTEFLDKAFLTVGAAFVPTALSIKTKSRADMHPIAERILNKEIILDDAQFRQQNTDGSEFTTRYLPVNQILLDRKTNSSYEMDYGNGVVTESIVAAMVGGAFAIGSNPKMKISGSYGPLGYFTAPTDLDPPAVTAYAVSRGWPRKHRPESTAVFTAW